MDNQCGFNGSRKPPEGTKAGDLVDCSACKAKLIWGFSAIPVLLQIPVHERDVDCMSIPYKGHIIERQNDTFMVSPPDTDDFSLTAKIEEAREFIDTLLVQ